MLAHELNFSPFYIRSLCSNGLYSSDYERLKKVFLQTYGFEHLLTFSLLVRSGLIVLKDSTSSVLLNTATRKVTGGGQGASATGPRAARPNFQSVVKKFSLQPTGAASQGFVFRHTSQYVSCNFVSKVSHCYTNSFFKNDNMKTVPKNNDPSKTALLTSSTGPTAPWRCVW